MDDSLYPPGGIEPRNLTAQLQYNALGNPPSTHPDTAISNAFPGLEVDFRNVWRRILVGIELHESSNLVVGVDDGAPPELRVLRDGYLLQSVDGTALEVDVKGPDTNGNIGPLPAGSSDTRMPMEWSNALAFIIHRTVQASQNAIGTNGQIDPVEVECVFRSLREGQPNVTATLMVRPFFEVEQLEDGSFTLHAVIAQDAAPPGVLSQSLCSPWQNDYRECACFYWAASRPDYVNIETRPDGTSEGHNWLHKNRTPDTPRVYVRDDFTTEELVTYEDLFLNWENKLHFEIDGRDAD